MFASNAFCITKSRQQGIISLDLSKKSGGWQPLLVTLMFALRLAQLLYYTIATQLSTHTRNNHCQHYLELIMQY